MITIKTEKEIEVLREGGRRLAVILTTLAQAVIPGISAVELNELAIKLVKADGDVPAFLNYKPSGAKRPYPGALCVSINDEVVHGLAIDQDKILKEGDIVSLDLGLNHGGLITDMSVTVPVGEVRPELLKLINITREALQVGIKTIKDGSHVGDIGYAIERFVRPYGYGIVEDLCGHGVGHKVHEDPFIPNFGEKGRGEKLKVGMVLALEPMLNLGTKEVFEASDGFTYKTADSEPSAHFEHTVVVTKYGAEILTKI